MFAYPTTDYWIVRVGDVILVIDVGGGTTDLSLIAVTEREGSLELTRVAVGDHILLGGDNMDLALAHVVKNKLAAEGKALDPWQVQALTHGCRHAKEALLADDSIGAVPVVVPSRGSRLISGSVRTELTRDEVARTLVDGFFPEVAADARPAARSRGALTRLGLPYAQDPAVTRHFAAFLGMQTGATDDLPGFAARGGSFLHPTAGPVQRRRLQGGRAPCSSPWTPTRRPTSRTATGATPWGCSPGAASST